MRRSLLVPWLALLGCAAPRPNGATEPGVEVGEPPPTAPRSAQGTPSGDCPPDEPAPPARRRPKGPRPFINVLPHQDVPLTPTTPARDERIGKVTCKAKHEVWRDEQGRLRVCTVAQPATLFGIDVARDAYTHFYEDGRPYQTHLARPHDLTTAKGDTVPCAADLVVLSTSGNLEHCKLARPATFSGVACRKGESVGFHASGALAGAVVDTPVTVAGAELPAGTRLHWFPDGKLAGGWLAEAARLDGVLVRWEFALHPNGRLRAFSLEEPRSIGGHAFEKRAKIELRPDGSLKYAEFEVAHGFMPHGEPWHDTKYVRYDCKNRVLGEYVEHYQADMAPWQFRKK
ncbi:MAG: hypothetical protein HS104_34075 [Polyangiaceae bacterium]|nr:hypothetical protein [Polyangiaceae bacterium]MCE7889688.1 hypothetical protein [Sorangiineae bacterium PRO1]MCL4752292.1 hypothetical protein [Myxococcales bacterium]